MHIINFLWNTKYDILRNVFGARSGLSNQSEFDVHLMSSSDKKFQVPVHRIGHEDTQQPPGELA